MKRSYGWSQVASGARWRQWLGGGVALALLAALGFSSKAIFVKLAYAEAAEAATTAGGAAALPLAAITLVTLRMLFSLPFFAWVAWRWHGARLSARQWGQLLLLGCIGFYGAAVLDFAGLQYISAGLERMILFTYPTFVLLYSCAAKRQWPSKRAVLALILAYGGIALALWHDVQVAWGQTAHSGVEVYWGAALVLASALCFALYLIGCGGMVNRLGAMRYTALAMLAATFGAVLHFSLTQSFHVLLQPWSVQVLVLAMAVFSTVLPAFAQSASVRVLGASTAAIVSMVGPVLTLALAALVLQEPISTWQIAGLAMVLGGVWLVGRKT